MKRKQKRQSYRNRLVSTMVVLIVLAVLTAVLATAFSLTHTFAPQLDSLRSQIAEQDVENLRNQLTGVTGSMTNLGSSQEVKALLSDRTDASSRTEAILKVSQRINSIFCSSDKIKLLFVYVEGLDKIISVGSEEALTYLRYRISGDWESAAALQERICRATKLSYLSCPADVVGENRVLEILPIPLGSVKPQAYVCSVIEPGMERFREGLTDIKLLCTDEHLLSSVGVAGDNRLTDEEVRRLVEGAPDTVRLFGEEYHVRKMPLPFGNLYYIYLTSDALFRRPMHQAYLLSFASCAVFSLLAALLAMTCSHKLYSPVGTMINALVAQGRLAEGKNCNELAAISSLVDRLLEDNHELNRTLDALTPMLDDLIFYQTLHHPEGAEGLQWLQAFENSFLQLVELRFSQRQPDGALQEKMLNCLAQNVQNELKPLFCVRAALMDNAVFLMVSHDMPPEGFRLKTAIALDKTMQRMISMFGTPVLYTVSQAFPRQQEPRENAVALQQMAVQCEKMFQQGFLQSQPSGGIWFVAAPLQKKEGCVEFIPASLENRLISLIGSGKAEDAWNELLQFLNDQLYNHSISFEGIWKLLTGSLDLLFKACAAAHLEAEPLLGSYQENCRNLRGMLTFSDAVCTLHGLFEKIAAAQQERTQGLPVSQTALDEYIDQHWLQEISLSVAAEHWMLSEGYFSEVVKRLTGRNYPDYLNGRRVQRAMEMMNDRQLTITEIAERAGFNNYKTFSRCFRKYYHVSPSDYRKTMGAEEKTPT